MSWPLTTAQIETSPWGLSLAELDPDRGKVITDPVHGDVLLMPIEVMVIDSPAFQRLRRVRQLGTTHLVYPGATHSRFSHGVGTLQVAQRLLDVLLGQREGLHSTPDLFEEWAKKGKDVLDRESARVIVLARLGALLHDLLHVPFGHSIEDELRILDRHDANENRFTRLWDDLGEAVLEVFAHEGLDAALRPLILSKADYRGEPGGPPQNYEYPFVADLVGNTICADLLDYLDRDHRNTGIPFSLGKRFTASFYAVPAHHPLYPKKMAMRIDRKDHERTDVVTELLKALRYRYELSERVLFHHAKLATDVMVGKCFGYLYDSFWLSATESWAAAEGKEQFEPGLDVEGAEARQRFRAAFGAEAAETVANQARGRLDELLTSRGDDGLLEHIERLGVDATDKSTVESQSLATAGEIAGRILRRRLFKAAGRASRTGAPAKDLYRKYELPDARRKLEREAEEYAELGPAPKVAIWLPDPSMKVKPADVLVDYRGTINTFYSYEEDGSGRGSDIYSAHARLWGLWVFVDHGVSPEDRRIVLSFLSRELGVRWDEEDPMLGKDPTTAPDHLAAMLVSETDEANKKVEELIETVATHRARGEVKTFNELKTVYEQARDLPDDGDEVPSS